MVKWMAEGRDATLPPSDPVDRSICNGLPLVMVLEYSDECMSNFQERKNFLFKIDNALSNGQAIVVNGWNSDAAKQWGWNEDDLSQLTGGSCAGNGPNLSAKAVWQCELMAAESLFQTILTSLHLLAGIKRSDPAHMEDTSYHYDRGTLKDFKRHVDANTDCVNLLDIPVLMNQRPWFLE